MSGSIWQVLPASFMSGRTLCRGDLYVPEKTASPPLLIMAHGFGAERVFGLPAYAERFVQHGLAVLLFDYRNFGASDGKPRNYVDPRRHLADWRAALAYARTLDTVNTDRIALWGSSFSGGHVMVTAAKDAKVAAIVAQVPFVDPFSTIQKLGIAYLAKATPHALRDIARMATFRKAHCVKIIGTPDEFAVMNTPDAIDGFKKLVPEETDWQNRCPARILLTFPLYRPLSHARKIKCPALVMGAEKDALIDIQAVRKTADAIADVDYVEYPIEHFDIYTGQFFENAVTKQADFLTKHLLAL